MAGYPFTLETFGQSFKSYFIGRLTTLIYFMGSFNSVVFEELSANEYSVIVINETFLSGAAWNWDAYVGLSSLPNPAPNLQYLQDNVNDTKIFQRLSNSECIKSYADVYLVGRRNLFVITSDSTGTVTNSSVLYLETSTPSDKYSNGKDPLGWICASTPAYIYTSPQYRPNAISCNPNDALGTASEWKVFRYPVEYCLSEIVPGKCKLRFNLDIMVAVIICNAIKLACFIYTLLRQKADSLITVG